MKNIKILTTFTAVTLSALLMLGGCSSDQNSAGQSQNSNAKTATADYSLALDTEDMFTSRDFETGYDESEAKNVTLSDNDPDLTITEAGVYVLSGTVSDGTITVDVPDTDKVQIVLNGASITSKTSAALYVKSADKVFVTTAKGTENTLANGGSFTDTGDDNIDGAVFSKDDIVFSGEGTLNIISPAKHGVVGKDDVKFTSGTYNIDAASHGVDANDSIRIANASLTIKAGKDGLHSDNDEDTLKGYIYIQSGTLDIDVDDDGIHAITTLQIDGGTFKISAAEGLEATVVIINDGTLSITASDDGINAAKKSTISTPTVVINGGNIKIVMGQGDTDGVDSNGDIIINGGTIDVTGNSTFDYEGTGVINGGTVIVNGSEVDTLPNQFAGGGPGGQGGQRGPGGMRGDMNGASPDTVTSATPNANGERPEMPNFEDGTRQEMPNFDKDGERPELPEIGSDGERPTPPNFDSNSEERPTPPDFNGSKGGKQKGSGKSSASNNVA
ncbi:MAG: carbohydrate-binding domain-containing protein [Clostridia bacterium]|nr:carbohydrate-binding domain-containing protein [Clostridia bacterium]